MQSFQTSKNLSFHKIKKSQPESPTFICFKGGVGHRLVHNGFFPKEPSGASLISRDWGRPDEGGHAFLLFAKVMNEYVILTFWRVVYFLWVNKIKPVRCGRIGSPDHRPRPLDTSQTSIRMVSRHSVQRNWDSVDTNQCPFSYATGARRSQARILVPAAWDPQTLRSQSASPLIFVELLSKT